MSNVSNTINKSGTQITVVANYSALPDPTTVSGKFYWAEASQGTSWLPGSLGGTYYNSGMYYSNGVSWSFVNVPYQATQSEVNTGTNTDKFVTPDTLKNSSQFQYLDATSSIQTQLDARVKTNRYVFQGKTSITGVTGEQDICSFKIPAGAYSNTSDAFKFDFTPIKSVTASTSTWKVYIGTTANARSNPIMQLAITTSNRISDVTRRYGIDAGTLDTAVTFTANSLSGLSPSSTLNTPIAVNMANDLWITITANPTASGESHGILMASITPLK